MYDLNRISDIALSFDATQKAYAITLALKITDDSCKMDDYERSVFMKLYDALPDYCSDLFDDTVPQLIEIARTDPTAYVFGEIRLLRKKGMDILGRAGMKAFKAEVRRQLKD